MRQDDDGDFAAYAAARWPTLVRTVVLLGCPPLLAADVVVSALARCRSSWGRIRAEDPDQAVQRTLVEAWADRRTTSWWEGLPPHDPLAVEAALDRLTPQSREVLVLSDVGDLRPAQVAEVTGRSPSYVLEQLDSRPVPASALLEAGQSIAVTPAPDVTAIAAHARGRPRPAVRAGAVLATILVAGVVAAATWAGTRPAPKADPDALTDVVATVADNPADVIWFENDRLHLAGAVLQLADVAGLARVGPSVVYGDEAGRVVLVEFDGTRTTLGHASPGAPIVVGQEEGWGAWVDPRRADPELVVHDLASGELLARRALPRGGGGPAVDAAVDARVIAVDAGRVYWSDADGVHAWHLSSNTVRAEDDGLLDVASAVRVFTDEDTIRVEQPVVAVTLVRPGRGAQLSPDGELVLTGVPDARAAAGAGAGAARASVRIYDTRSGADVPTGLRDDDYVVAAELGRDRRVTYVVARAEDRPQADEFVRQSFSGRLELRTCLVDPRLPAAGCRSLATFASTGQVPLLAD